jgi:hypothetical protein
MRLGGSRRGGAVTAVPARAGALGSPALAADAIVSSYSISTGWP